MLKTYYLFRVTHRGAPIPHETYPNLNDGYELHTKDYLLDEKELDEMENGKDIFDHETLQESMQLAQFKIAGPCAVLKHFFCGGIIVVMYERQGGAKHSNGELRTMYHTTVFDDGKSIFGMSSRKLHKATAWFCIKMNELKKRWEEEKRPVLAEAGFDPPKTRWAPEK